MNLFNPMTTIGKMTKPFEHPYKGKVVQVDNDPEYIGRIKVDIPELFGQYEESGGESTAGILPWIYPRYIGKFRGLLELDFPEVGDVVEVIFPYKNIYVGYYINKPLYKDVWDRMEKVDSELGKKLRNIFCGDHYSDVYGSYDRNLTGWYIDKVLDEIFFIQGTTKGSIRIDTEGSWHIYVPKSVYIDVVEDVEINVGRDVKINIGNNLDNDIVNDVTTHIGNNKSITIDNDETIEIGNDLSNTIGNNVTNEVGTKITTHVPDMVINVDNTITITTTTMNTTATIVHTGTVTSTGEGIFNNVTVSQHINVGAGKPVQGT